MRRRIKKRKFLSLFPVAVLGLCLFMAPEVFGQQSVEVFKDGVYVGTRDSIAAALTELVPDPLDGNYELVAAEGSYDEIMFKRGRLKVGIVIDHHTYNPATGIQHALTIRAAEGATVWLGGPGSLTVTRRMQITSTADNVTLEGLRVSNATDMGIWVELDPEKTMTGVDDLTIMDCEFSNANNGSTSMKQGIFVAGGRLDRRLQIIGNRIFGVNCGINLKSGQGDPDNYAKVMHNVIYNLTNEDPAKAAAIRVSANPALEVNPDRIEISNNTLYNFGPVGIWLEKTGGGGGKGKGKKPKPDSDVYMPTNIRVRNNIIWAVSSGSACIWVDEPEASNTGPYLEVSDYNDLYVTEGAHVGEWGTIIADDLATWQIVSAQDLYSLSTDPLFADVVYGDFYLLSAGGRWLNGEWVIDPVTSPCIDAGQPGTDPADYNLEPEPNGGLANQGAYGGTNEASKTPS